MNFLDSIKVLPTSTRVFVVRAGNGARYREIFEKESKVFLEIPGVTPVSELIKQCDTEQIRKLLQRSTDIIRTKDPKAVDDYNGDKSSIASLYGSFLALYTKAKVGDLVLVPNLGYQAPFLIGEIVSDFSDEDVLSLDRYPKYKIPFRKVRWLSKDINKKRASLKLSDKLKNRKAVIEITEKAIKKEIFGYAFKKYVYDNTSKVSLLGEKYNGNNLDGIIDTLQAIQLLIQTLNIEKCVDIKINFNSPGSINIIGQGSKAIIIAAVMSSGVANVSYAQTMEDLKEAEIVRACQDRPILDSLDEDTFREVCGRAQNAKKEIQLEVP